MKSQSVGPVNRIRPSEAQLPGQPVSPSEGGIPAQEGETRPNPDMQENQDENEEAGSDLESEPDIEDKELQVNGFLGADGDKQEDGGFFWWRNVFSTSSSTIELGVDSKWAHFRGVRYFNYG